LCRKEAGVEGSSPDRCSQVPLTAISHIQQSITMVLGQPCKELDQLTPVMEAKERFLNAAQ
jgi:hypothetical protein